MNYKSVIRNFGQCNTEQAKRLKAELGLSMSEDVLLYCIAHYKNHELRDPFVDELFMLDRLSAALEKDPDAFSPTDLFTRDDFVAETYADMMAKRRQLNPDTAHPCTLAEASKLASVYMLRSGKFSAPLRSAAVVPESIRDRQAFPSESCLAAPDSAFRLRVLPFATAKPAVGDLLVLLSPGATQTRLSFYKATEKLLESETVYPLIKGIYTVRRSGLLRELLEITNSMRLVLSPFSSLDSPMPMTVLTDHHEGCRILRIRADAREKLMQLIRTTNVSASLFAEITDDGRFAFYRGEDDFFSIHPQFLRTLYRYKGVSLKLATESKALPDQIRHRTVTPYNCKYLSREITDCASDVASINGVLASSASASPERAYYKTALYTALIPVLTLAASGIRYTDQVLSLGLEMPDYVDSSVAVGEGMSVLLGLYRAQTELGIPAQAISLRTESAVKHPTVSAFALCEGGKTVCNRFTASDHEVYCLTPKFHHNGMPHFQSLRQMMDEVTRLQNDGKIASMSIIGNESVTDALARMSHAVTCRLTDLTVASDGPIPIGILIESTQKLPYPAIGITRTSQKEEESKTVQPAETAESLVWSAVPEIVILARKTDTDAQTLVSVLECRGARVHLFSDSITESDRLSRAILGAQSLIQCKGCQLPKTEKVEFALSVMQKANGRMLALGYSSDAEKGFLSVPEGLDRALLQKICPERKKNGKKS